MAGWTLCPPPLSSRILSFAWTYSPDSLILLHPAIDFVAVSLSPSLTYALTPGHCVPLGGLPVLVGSSTYPSLGRMLGPSSIGLWLCWRLGCRPVPSSHFLDSVSYLACSLDLLQTPCYSGMLGGLLVLVGSFTSPSPGRLFELSYIGRLLCLRLG